MFVNVFLAFFSHEREALFSVNNNIKTNSNVITQTKQKKTVQSRAGGQGPYLRLLDHLARSIEVKNPKNLKKVKCVESRSTRLKTTQTHTQSHTDTQTQTYTHKYTPHPHTRPHYTHTTPYILTS